MYDSDSILLFIGITGILVVASVIGYILKKKVVSPNPVIDNLNTRINAWWVMVIVIGITFAIGDYAVILLFCLISGLALKEFIALTPATKDDRYALIFAFGIALPMQYILIAMNWYGLYSIFIPVYAFLLLPILLSIAGSTKQFLERVILAKKVDRCCLYDINENHRRKHHGQKI